MTQPFDMEIEWEELINRGLNTRVPDLKPQIDKLISAVINDEVKKRFPKIKQQPWHLTYIKFYDTTEKYKLTVAPGFSTLKG